MRYCESHNNPVGAINLSHGVTTNRVRVNLILLAEDRILFPSFLKPLLLSASLKSKEYICHLKACDIKGFSIFHRLKYLTLNPE